ncbi:ATP-binding protein [Lacinutrix iliipiscaria]|uniref:ATP-binding protein n=1 Tax=Lacinutrix iliipiscaria TaxID=1230532 RepID=A0ABW5WMP6_9FLAO
MNNTRIKISNIGPINEVNFSLNKVNVFMGEQSSGKSTIAKIVSYCQWVEKRYLLDGEYKYDFKEQFIEFHKVDENYFNKNSSYSYETDFVLIQYKGTSFKEKVKRKERNLEYLKSKNIYIPAERNFVSVIPNLSRFKETNDNIMSFLYDWYDAKKQYSKEKSLPVLSLGINYHHIEDTDSDVLTLIEPKKEISLRNASSGLQSVIPLIMIIDYLTNSFYKKKKSSSVNEKENIKSLITQVMKEYSSKSDSEFEKFSLNDRVEQILNLVKNKSDYHYSSFIIEEPEQNLFPKTQKELVYYLLNRISETKRNHTLTITTHSPYILYALNNCIMASLIHNNLSDSEKNKLDCIHSKIDPKLISIFQIKNGMINTIQQNDGLIGENFFDAQMKEVMDEFYIMLNHYE